MRLFSNSKNSRRISSENYNKEYADQNAIFEINELPKFNFDFEYNFQHWKYILINHNFHTAKITNQSQFITWIQHTRDHVYNNLSKLYIKNDPERTFYDKKNLKNWKSEVFNITTAIENNFKKHKSKTKLFNPDRILNVLDGIQYKIFADHDKIYDIEYALYFQVLGYAIFKALFAICYPVSFMKHKQLSDHHFCPGLIFENTFWFYENKIAKLIMKSNKARAEFKLTLDKNTIWDSLGRPFLSNKQDDTSE